MFKLFKKIAILWAVLITALVATPAYAGNSVELKDGKETVMSIGYSPVDSAVIPWDENMEAGNYTGTWGIMAPEMRVEYTPLAPIHPAVMLDGRGVISRGYAMAAGFRDCSDLGRITLIAVFPGVTTRTPDQKVVILDRRVTGQAYSLDGRLLPAYDKKRFAKDAEYRRQYIATNGTPYAAGPNATNFLRQREFPYWQKDNIEGFGGIKTPLTGEAYTEVMGKNPEYSFGQKLEANSSLTISPNVYEVGTSAVMSFVSALFAKTKGFDRKSHISVVESDQRAQALLDLQNDGVQRCRRIDAAMRK
jgi:hypothetical protein